MTVSKEVKNIICTLRKKYSQNIRPTSVKNTHYLQHLSACAELNHVVYMKVVWQSPENLSAEQFSGGSPATFL
jgi:hypothetical protein